MSWMRAGKHHYLRIAVRRDGRTEQLYFGRGMAAVIALQCWRETQRKRAEARAAWMQQRAALETLDRDLRRWYELANLLAAGKLLLAGYHRRYRGPWRKPGVGLHLFR